jgi:hypothetical protein
MKTSERVGVLMKIDATNVNGMYKYKDIYKLDSIEPGFVGMTNEEYEAWYNRNVSPYYVKPQKNEE